jgi:hypothetical protein
VSLLRFSCAASLSGKFGLQLLVKKLVLKFEGTAGILNKNLQVTAANREELTLILQKWLQ